MKITKEFREFAIKGSVFDMAVGIIIGTAFHRIVTSLVNDILMPPLGYFLGKVDFKKLEIPIQPEQRNEAGQVVIEGIAISYGNFLQVSFDFILIALIIFAVIKVFNSLRRKAEDVNEPSVPTPKNIELLSEIRDLLKKTNTKT